MGAVCLLEAFVVDELVAQVVKPQHIGVGLVRLPLVPGLRKVCMLSSQLNSEIPHFFRCQASVV